MIGLLHGLEVEQIIFCPENTCPFLIKHLEISSNVFDKHGQGEIDVHDIRICQEDAPVFTSPFCLSSQDLKPSNLAVNEDCELKVRSSQLKTMFTVYDLVRCSLKYVVPLILLLFYEHVPLSVRSWTSVWHGTQMMR